MQSPTKHPHPHTPYKILSLHVTTGISGPGAQPSELRTSSRNNEYSTDRWSWPRLCPTALAGHLRVECGVGKSDSDAAMSGFRPSLIPRSKLFEVLSCFSTMYIYICVSLYTVITSFSLACTFPQNTAQALWEKQQQHLDRPGKKITNFLLLQPFFYHIERKLPYT